MVHVGTSVAAKARPHDHGTTQVVKNESTVGLLRTSASHPFFSVTSTDGKFTISGLDPGTYEITAWHEKLGTQTASVTVGASDTKTQNFKFAVPAK